MRPSITTIINMCSGDRNFIIEHIESIKDFSDEIRIPYSTHLYSGNPDDMTKMQLVKNACSKYNIKFIEFDKVIGSPLGQNTARWAGSQNLKTDYVLYMDADEIFEKNKINNWVNNFNYNDYDAINFQIHFYSMNSNHRACLNEEEAKHYVGNRDGGNLYARGEKAGMLVKTNLITHQRIMHGVASERWSFIADPAVNNKLEHVLALDQSIMLHHYAYVRSKDEMKRKILGSFHINDKPWAKWAQLIDDNFDDNFHFNSSIHRDICHGYILKETLPPHKIFSLEEFDKIYG